MTPKFQIGDKVFKGTYDRREKWVTCPDCLGSKTVKVILADSTELTIECGGCDPGGYKGSIGRIRQYDWSTDAKEMTVTGVCMKANSVSYELNNWGEGSYYTGTDEDTFATKDEAQAHGDIEKVAREADENKRLMAKTKNARSWAWNATYHRRCIKDHEEQLEYHRSKVQICAAKAKEPAPDAISAA